MSYVIIWKRGGGGLCSFYSPHFGKRDLIKNRSLKWKSLYPGMKI